MISKIVIGGGGVLAVAMMAIGGIWAQDRQAESRRPILAQSFEQAPTTPRLLILGTSLTDRYDWPSAVIAALGDCLNRSVEGTVIAGAGQTSRWGLARMDDILAARPDVVVIEFTINDADVRQRISPTDSLMNHAAIIDQVRANLPQTRIVLVGTNPIFGLRGLLRLRLQPYLSGYETLAQDDPLTGFVDLAGVWQARIDQDGRAAIVPDGVHPDLAAAQDVIVPPLSTELARLLGATCPDTEATIRDADTPSIQAQGEVRFTMNTDNFRIGEQL